MKIRSTIAACAASLLVLTSVNAANEVRTGISGSACAPTSLGQALNLNASWGAKGVRNPNTVASGTSFFVVCPVPTAARKGETSENPTTDSVRVHPAYQDLSTTRMSCTAKRYNVDGTLLKSVAMTGGAPNPSGGIYANVQRASNVIDSADGWLYLGYDESIVVVCALPPQSSVVSVGITY